MKHSTPILSAVKAMHAEEDKGRETYPYGRPRPTARSAGATHEQKHEAEQVLACYETRLTIKE